MEVKSIEPSSKLNIYTSFSLSNDDVQTLSLLYAPLIGSDAFSLYMYFNSLLERNKLACESLTHKDLFTIFSLKSKTFLEARYKLEAVGLLRTYYSEDEYIYILNAPLTAKSFIKDVSLGLYLYSKLNKELYDYIYSHFKIAKIDKEGYENITKTFDEVFKSNVYNGEIFSKFEYILGKNPNLDFKISETTFDYDYFIKEINQDFLECGETEEFKSQIINLAYTYEFNPYEMISLFNQSLNQRGYFDYKILKRKANALYLSKYNESGPSLSVKDDKSIDPKNIIEFLEHGSPKDILNACAPNFPPSYLGKMADIYTELTDMGIKEIGVINCMIMKILTANNGEMPSVNYFKKAALTWLADNVMTTEDAINYSTTYKVSNRRKTKIVDDDPNGGYKTL